MDALQLNIYVNSDCTRQCPDCYYPKKSKMSLDMAFRIAAWALKFCENEQVKLFKMHILGGEPLLNLVPVFTLVELLKALPAHPDGKYVIFTNGDLLTEDILRQFKKLRIMILLNPTNNSFDEINRRMRLIKSICGGVSLAVVADGVNLQRLPDLVRLAVEYKGHIRINRLYSGGTIPGYVEKFGKQMHKVFDVLLAADKPMWPNFILESTYPLWEGPKNCHACGRWLLVINPDGTIRSCNADLSTICGHITTHSLMQDFNFMHRWSSKNIPECQGCEFALGGLCQGGCPFTRKLTYGTYDQRTPFCSVYKELFPRLLKLADKWKKFYDME